MPSRICGTVLLSSSAPARPTLLLGQKGWVGFLDRLRHHFPAGNPSPSLSINPSLLHPQLPAPPGALSQPSPTLIPLHQGLRPLGVCHGALWQSCKSKAPLWLCSLSVLLQMTCTHLLLQLLCEGSLNLL